MQQRKTTAAQDGKEGNETEEMGETNAGLCAACHAVWRIGANLQAPSVMMRGKNGVPRLAIGVERPNDRLHGPRTCPLCTRA